MAASLSLDLPPATRAYLETGELSDYAKIVAALTAIQSAYNALKAEVDILNAAPRIVVSTAEPTHDGSQRVNDLWGDK